MYLQNSSRDTKSLLTWNNLSHYQPSPHPLCLGGPAVTESKVGDQIPTDQKISRLDTNTTKLKVLGLQIGIRLPGYNTNSSHCSNKLFEFI